MYIGNEPGTFTVREEVIFKHRWGAFGSVIIHVLFDVNMQHFYKLPGTAIYSAEKPTSVTQLKIN